MLPFIRMDEIDRVEGCRKAEIADSGIQGRWRAYVTRAGLGAAPITRLTVQAVIGWRLHQTLFLL